MTSVGLIGAMVRVERVWLDGLVASGIAPAAAGGDLRDLEPEDVRGLVPVVAAGSEAGGNPVIPLLGLLRERLAPDPALWLHQGLTSQDVMDTALVLSLREVLAQVRTELAGQIDAVIGLAGTNRAPVAGRGAQSRVERCRI